MKLYFLGICGTFMGSLAILARQMGFVVSGCDANIYPPMSDILRQAGIQLDDGYTAEAIIKAQADLIIIGNTIKRGNPALEYILNSGLPYQSGPAWLSEALLQQRQVFAVAGTHGKTTTSSMLAWVLHVAALKPGYLIGGAPRNFTFSADLGAAPFFVIEADEYDTAFFDKRSKFLHYRPRYLLLNQVEFDHADIFADLKAVQQQFAWLLRTLPSNGTIFYPVDDENILQIFQQGCWTPLISYGIEKGDWQARNIARDHSAFEVWHDNCCMAEVNWHMAGLHNIKNALNVFAAAHQIDIEPKVIAQALQTFIPPKRRLEKIGTYAGATIYNDFAHHPTAIATTLDAVHALHPEDRVIVVIEFGSNSMKQGVWRDLLPQALQTADHVIMLQTAAMQWQAADLASQLSSSFVAQNVNEILTHLNHYLRTDDRVIVMSNGAFQGLVPLLHSESAKI